MSTLIYYSLFSPLLHLLIPIRVDELSMRRHSQLSHWLSSRCLNRHLQYWDDESRKPNTVVTCSMGWGTLAYIVRFEKGVIESLVGVLCRLEPIKYHIFFSCDSFISCCQEWTRVTSTVLAVGLLLLRVLLLKIKAYASLNSGLNTSLILPPLLL